MDLISQLKIGDKFNIERYEGNILLDKKSILNSQLVDLHGENIYISIPMYKGKKYLLKDGQKISIFFYRDSGVFQFFAEVIEQNKKDMVTFSIKPTSELKKIQRRNYFRLPVVMKVVIERKQEDEILTIECVTKDLSGGGIKAVCNKETKEGEVIKTNLYLNEKDVITLESSVVRVIKDKTTNAYELGIAFKNIEQTNEDKIFAFIFEKQRLLRKKGLI